MAEPQVIPVQAALEYIDSTAETMGVDPALGKQIFLAENIGKAKDGRLVAPTAVSTDTTSPTGARGLMQVMPATLQGLIKNGRLPAGHTMDDWKSQIQAGLAAIADMQVQHKSTDPSVIGAAYNGGPSSGNKVIAGQLNRLPAETSNYLLRMSTARDILGIGNAPTMSPGTATAPLVPTAATAPATPAGITTGNDTIDRGLTALQKTYSDYSGMVDELTRGVVTSTDQVVAAKGKEAAAITAAGEAAGKSAGITGAMNAAIEKMRERTASIFRIDTRTSDNIVVEELTKQANLKAQIDPLGAEIDARQSVGFFDNPLQYLINATVLPGKVAAYNAAATGYNTSQNIIHSTQELATSQNRVDVAGISDLMLKHGIAVADAEVAKGNARAEAARAEGASAQAQAKLTIARLADTKGDNAVRNIQLSLQMLDREERGTARRDERESLLKTREQVKTMADAIGAPGVTLESLKGKNATVQNEWSRAVSTGSPGDSFAEATIFIQKYGNLPNMARSRAEVAQYQKFFQDRLVREKDATFLEWKALNPTSAKNPTDTQLYELVANKMEREFRAQAATNMINASQINPYVISHANTVRDWKGAPDNIVYQFVTAKSKEGVRINDNILIESIRAQVKEGKIEPKVAAQQLSEYYAEAVRRNNSARNFEFMGLPAQDSYKVIAQNAKRGIDLVNRAEVEKLFTQDRILTLRGLLQASMFGTLPGAVIGTGIIAADKISKSPEFKKAKENVFNVVNSVIDIED